MRKKSSFVLIAIMGLVVSAAAWRGSGWLRQRLLTAYVTSQTNQPTSIPSIPASGLTIPFEMVNRHVFLEVTVNNSRPLSFILDTGDNWALIDLDRAKELSLELGGEIAVRGVGGQLATGTFVKDSAFAISGLPGFSQPVRLAIPLRNMAPRLGHDFDGVIGAEFIKQFVLELDYQAKVIKVHDKDTFAYSGPGESIPIQLNAQGHPIIEAEVTPVGGNPIKGTFTLDIGAGGSLALSSPFVAEHHLPGPNVMTIKDLGGAGTGGETTGQYGRVFSLKIGKFIIRNPITLFSDDKAGALASSSIQGNIGEEVLSKFKLFFDYSHDRIILEPNETFAEAFNRAFSGLLIETEGDDYKTFSINKVLENSPGSDAGLQKNDVIKSIDGRAASELTLSEVLEIFRRAASHKLTVGRGEQVLTVTLKPRSLV